MMPDEPVIKFGLAEYIVVKVKNKRQLLIMNRY